MKNTYYCEKINGYCDVCNKNIVDFNKYYHNITNINKKIPLDFRTRLKFFRKELNLSREKLSELSYVSE